MLSVTKLDLDYALGYGMRSIYYIPNDYWPDLNKYHLIHVSCSSACELGTSGDLSSILQLRRQAQGDKMTCLKSRDRASANTRGF